MNTITVQLNDKQFDALQDLLDYAMDHLDWRISLEGEYGYRDDFQAELDMAGEVADVLNQAKTYLWSSGDGHLELEIPAQAVEDIAQVGDNEPAVNAWLYTHGPLRKQLMDMQSDVMATYLVETGLDLEARTVWEMRQLLLWTACWDIAEERNQE